MMKNKVKAIEYTIILLGEPSVGKTTFFNKFIFDKKKFNYISTISVDFETKTIEYNNKKYLITLYDTAGQERFKSITQAYYHLADGFFIMFDLTNEHSLNAIKNWIETVLFDNKNNIFLILGNKDDLNNKISDDDINEVLGNYKHLFIKTSAIHNINIDEAFAKLIDMIEDENNLANLEEKKSIKSNSFHLKRKKNKENNQSNEDNDKCC